MSFAQNRKTNGYANVSHIRHLYFFWDEKKKTNGYLVSFLLLNLLSYYAILWGYCSNGYKTKAEGLRELPSLLSTINTLFIHSESRHSSHLVFLVQFSYKTIKNFQDVKTAILTKSITKKIVHHSLDWLFYMYFSTFLEICCAGVAMPDAILQLNSRFQCEVFALFGNIKTKSLKPCELN